MQIVGLVIVLLLLGGTVGFGGIVLVAFISLIYGALYMGILGRQTGQVYCEGLTVALVACGGAWLVNLCVGILSDPTIFYIAYFLLLIAGLVYGVKERNRRDKQDEEMLEKYANEFEMFCGFAEDFAHFSMRSRHLAVSRNYDGRGCRVSMSIFDGRVLQEIFMSDYEFYNRHGLAGTNFFDQGYQPKYAFRFEDMLYEGQIENGDDLKYEWILYCDNKMIPFIADAISQKYPENFERLDNDLFSLSFH